MCATSASLTSAKASVRSPSGVEVEGLGVGLRVHGLGV